MRVRSLALLLSLGVLGCSTTLRPVDLHSPSLALLSDGQTTEAEVMAQLGTVMRRFPDGVMVYRLWREKNLLSAVKVTRDDAYDLVQDTFISTWLALRRYDARKPFSVWLRAIALNKCRDHGRRRAVRRRFLKLFASQPPQAHSALQDREEASLQAKRLRQLDQAIAALPRVYKEPLLLTTVAGLTQQQTAEQLKTSTKAIEMRIRRAKKRLSEALPKSEENELVREG